MWRGYRTHERAAEVDDDGCYRRSAIGTGLISLTPAGADPHRRTRLHWLTELRYHVISSQTEAITLPAITIRNLPEPVHNALRRIAAERRMSVEALARAALGDLARQARAGGIDFAKLARDRAALGLTEDGPEWTEALDDPALSRRVLALDAE